MKNINSRKLPAAYERVEYFEANKYKLYPMIEKIKDIIKNDQIKIVDQKELRIASQNKFYSREIEKKGFSGDLNHVGKTVRLSFSLYAARKIGGFLNAKYVLMEMYSVELIYAESFPLFGPCVQYRLNGVVINGKDDINGDNLRDLEDMKRKLSKLANAPSGDLIYNASPLDLQNRVKNDF